MVINGLPIATDRLENESGKAHFISAMISTEPASDAGIPDTQHSLESLVPRSTLSSRRFR